MFKVNVNPFIVCPGDGRSGYLWFCTYFCLWNFNLAYNWELWELELWCFPWVFLVTRFLLEYGEYHHIVATCHILDNFDQPMQHGIISECVNALSFICLRRGFFLREGYRNVSNRLKLTLQYLTSQREISVWRLQNLFPYLITSF